MLNGYVTYDELKLITKGLNLHEADLEYNNLNKPVRSDRYKQTLFNLKEVEEWLRVHIF